MQVIVGLMGMFVASLHRDFTDFLIMYPKDSHYEVILEYIGYMTQLNCLVQRDLAWHSVLSKYSPNFSSTAG